MGPSGSGKTSLLNILADRVKKQKNAVLSGDVLYNGTEARSENPPLGALFDAHIRFNANDEPQFVGRGRDNAFRRNSSYVMQDDILYSQQTVYETLLLAARLRSVERL